VNESVNTPSVCLCGREERQQRENFVGIWNPREPSVCVAIFRARADHGGERYRVVSGLVTKFIRSLRLLIIIILHVFKT
jgi:hypothetical protein